MHSCAVTVTRTLWCWGNNADGELGLGDTTNRLTPTEVGAKTNWRQPSAGWTQTCAIRISRSLWCWVSNQYGQLGLGDTDDRLTP